jgi:hypothetical protein
MDPDLIAEAMTLALNLVYRERLDAAEQPVTGAWLAEGGRHRSRRPAIRA